MPPIRPKTPAQEKKYAALRKLTTHRNNVSSLREDFVELVHVVDFERLMNAQSSEIETLSKLLKKVAKLVKREDTLIAEGLVANEEIKTQCLPDEKLMETLNQMKTVEKKKLKYNTRKWDFNIAVITKFPDAIAEFGTLAYTLKCFRDSIDISKYSPTATDHRRAAIAEEKESIGLSEREMFAAERKVPPPLPKSKPPPLPKSKPPPVPEEFKKPEVEKPKPKAKPVKPVKAKPVKAKPVKVAKVAKSAEDVEIELEIKALEKADAEAPVSKKQFRLLFLNNFGDSLEEAAGSDPLEERTDEICRCFLKQCVEWTAVGRSSGLSRYALKNPKRALKLIHRLYIDGADEFLEPE